MKRALTIILMVIVIAISIESSLQALSSLANNDPYPIYTSFYDPYLSIWEREALKGFCVEKERETFSISISPFRQKANSGRTFGGKPALLGDIAGPWNMLGLLYGPLPAGVSLTNTQLGNAKVHIFSDLFASPLVPADANTIISNSENSSFLLVDSKQQVGFFSVPLKYTKMGVRFEINYQPFCDFGITLQGGVSEIKQTVTGFTDLSAIPDSANTIPQPFCRPIPIVETDGVTLNGNCTIGASGTTCANPGTGCTTPFAQIELELMNTDTAKTIFEQLGLDPCDFEKTSLEDLRVILWWRHAYPVNEGRDACWPRFLAMPSVTLNFTIPVAKSKDRSKLFSLPFGNDKHASLGTDIGLNLDFYETIELATKIGVTYFFARTIDSFRVPTFSTQSGIFPYATTVERRPGLNFNFNALVHAYRFLDYFSAHAEYVFVKHEQDRISIEDNDPAFLPNEAECISKFSSQFFNGAINYEISPNISLGFIGQFPISQRNSYRSTTWMATFRAVF